MAIARPVLPRRDSSSTPPLQRTSATLCYHRAYEIRALPCWVLHQPPVRASPHPKELAVDAEKRRAEKLRHRDVK